MNSDAFKDRLKVAMGKDSQRSFASKSGVSTGTLHNFLKGITTPDLETLQKIAEASGYRVAWLSSGEGPMRVNEEAYGLVENLKDADLSAEQLLNRALTIGRGADQLNLDLLVQIIKNMTEGRSKTELAEIDAALFKAVVDTMKSQDKERGK